MHIELRPNPLLVPYVETYWIVDDDKETKTVQSVLPDGCVDIIVSLSDSDLVEGLKPKIPFVFGTHTTHFKAPGEGHVRMFGVTFKPAVFHLFTKLPTGEFTDQTVDIFSFPSLFDSSFYSKVEQAIDADLPMNAIIGVIERFLIDKLPVLPSVDQRIHHAVSSIRAHGGNLTIAKLAVESGLSERQLERRFKEEVGIGPKTFSRIMRFQEAHKRLNTGSWANLQEVAWDCGYVDNAHLTRDYRRFSGALPSASSRYNR